jgi:hypothetical protein
LQYIDSTDAPARESKNLGWWLIYVLFAYHYKVIFCGLFGQLLGQKWICHTLVHGVTTNHWFEQLVYVPFLWLAYYKIIQIVFGPADDEVLGPKVKRLKLVAHFLLAMYIYGIGIHFANTIEIYSRKHLGIDSGPLYEQIWWVDEQLSHWIQFFFYFLFFAWIIVYDRLDRTRGSYLAVYTGIFHGLERALGVIEGDNPNTAFVYGALILGACAIRWRRHGMDFSRAWVDFFFRHGLSFSISLPLVILVYPLVFGGLVQPSSMGDKSWQAVAFAVVFSVATFCLTLLLDYLIRRKTSAR